MSLHEDIQQKMRGIIGDFDSQGVVLLSPALVADMAYAQLGDKSEDIHIRYACTEHFKQMARRILGAKFSADGDENATHQSDMFSGALQQRYPLPHKHGESMGYKLLAAMTKEELEWNVIQLRKSANARLEHADALRAYVRSRFYQAA